jgi:IS605 OrfB family transposase
MPSSIMARQIQADNRQLDCDHKPQLPRVRATCSSRDPPVREGGLRGRRPLGAVSTAGLPNTTRLPNTARSHRPLAPPARTARSHRLLAPPARPIAVHVALDELADHRHRAIESYLHTASRAIINLLVQEGIGMLVIGKNVGWKQEVNMGEKNNQSFVFTPHVRFIAMLTYKTELGGIREVTVEESHTATCSFLDLEPIGHHDRYLGRRVKRGPFLVSTGQTINAGVNGSYNILRRFAPDAFAQGIAQCVVRPIPLQLPDRHQDRSKQRHVARLGRSGCCGQPAVKAKFYYGYPCWNVL